MILNNCQLHYKFSCHNNKTISQNKTMKTACPEHEDTLWDLKIYIIVMG